MYGQVDLHPSQQVSDPPIIKRNLVRNIVAQFNAEAKKRNNKKNHETVMSNEELHYIPRTTSSPIYNNNDDDGQNTSTPFSYTSTLPFMYKKSKSEYDLKSPNEVIYAQVVVNGQGPNGKKTVHTKVPMCNGDKKYSTLTNGMNKNQSISMGNLQSTHSQSPYSRINIQGPSKTSKYSVSESTRVERSRSESPYAGHLSSDKHKTKTIGMPVTSKSSRRVTKEEESMTRKEMKTTTETKRDKSKDKNKERLRSKSEDNRVMNSSKSGPKEPIPDYNESDGWEKIEYRDVSSEFRKENKAMPTIKTRRRLTEEMVEPAPDYDDKFSNGFDEVDRSVWQDKHLTNGTSFSKREKEGQILVGNGITKEILRGSSSNLKTTEYTTQEKTVTRKHRSSSNEKKSHEHKETSSGKVRKEKDKNKKESEKKSNRVEKEMASTSGRRINTEHDAGDKKFYYFGANEEVIRPPRKKDKDKVIRTENNLSELSSTKLVKEANAQVSGQDRYKSGSKWRSTSESPTESANQDSGYFSRGGMSPISKDKTESPEPFKERIINVQVEGRKNNYQKSSSSHREEHVSSGFFNDTEERMETSESDDIPNPWVGGSRDSQISAPSNQWSSLEEDDEEIVAAHVNTPQSIIREMDKREISYENSQRPPEKDAELLWYGRSDVDTDYRKEMSTGCFNTVEPVRNENHVNNNWGTSATLSRLESNKNRINNDSTMRSSTVDRRQWSNQTGKNNNSNAVKILLNGRDITDSDTSTRQTTGILSKTSNYASETESQHSGRSKGSKKSNGSSPALKRVNFKTRSKAKRSVSSAANLSPIHREALMRAGSPVRPPSASESLQSSGSESNRSVILHATTVADIPPPISYRYRIYKESSLSGSPTPPESGRSGKTVTRTFSLLSPWKPKKYKEKHEKHENRLEKANESKESSSRNHSTEHLDSLSPLPSETGTSRKSKKVVRTNSVPKDTRFAGFFKRKKEKNVESK